MKRIYNNSDIQINLKSINGISDKFVIKFFTTNKEFFIRKTNENVYTVDDEKYIKLNWSELQTIGDGVLNYVFNNIKDDSDYDDGEYNNTISRTTNYYICSNFKVDPETDKSISEVIAELSDEFDTEKTRSTNKDTEHDTAISNLNDELEIEADARGAADLILQANIDQLQSKVDTKANKTDVYTKAESDAKYLTEHQDISNLASKTELNTVQTNLTTEIENESARARAKEIGLSGQIYDIEQSLATFETKTDHDADISDLDDRVTAIVANTYNKTQINNALESLEHNLQTNIDKKANIGDSYTKAQSDAKYLTEHQDISSLATKAELQSEATARQNADTTLQSNLTSEQNRAKAVEEDLQQQINNKVQGELNGTDKQIKIDNSSVAFADNAIYDCGHY